jgi:hypothetical protein
MLLGVGFLSKRMNPVRGREVGHYQAADKIRTQHSNLLPGRLVGDINDPWWRLLFCKPRFGAADTAKLVTFVRFVQNPHPVKGIDAGSVKSAPSLRMTAIEVPNHGQSGKQSDTRQADYPRSRRYHAKANSTVIITREPR